MPNLWAPERSPFCADVRQQRRNTAATRVRMREFMNDVTLRRCDQARPSLLDSLFYITFPIHAMRTAILLAVVIMMSSVADTSAQTLIAPKAVTDPKQI